MNIYILGLESKLSKILSHFVLMISMAFQSAFQARSADQNSTSFKNFNIEDG